LTAPRIDPPVEKAEVQAGLVLQAFNDPAFIRNFQTRLAVANGEAVHAIRIAVRRFRAVRAVPALSHTDTGGHTTRTTVDKRVPAMEGNVVRAEASRDKGALRQLVDDVPVFNHSNSVTAGREGPQGCPARPSDCSTCYRSLR